MIWCNYKVSSEIPDYFTVLLILDIFIFIIQDYLVNGNMYYGTDMDTIIQISLYQSVYKHKF